MSSGYVRAGANANRSHDKFAYRITQDCVLIDAVLTVAHTLWPRKTAAELALRSGSSPRTCERWISDRTGLSSDALAELLRSEDGLQFLEAIMAEAQPSWWKTFRKQAERSQIRKQIEQQRRRLDALDASDD